MRFIIYRLLFTHLLSSSMKVDLFEESILIIEYKELGLKGSKTNY